MNKKSRILFIKILQQIDIAISNRFNIPIIFK